jgi:hypothetical protein
MTGDYRSNVQDSYPLSPLQAGLLFDSVYDGDTTARLYANRVVYDLCGKVDRDCLRAAWQQVIDRHTSLRSSFVWDSLEQPCQVVHRRIRVPFTELDWRNYPPDEQERRLDALLANDGRRGFDLSNAPLMRLTLIRASGDRWLLLWSFHHLLLDGWSTTIVEREVSLLYREQLTGEPTGLGRPEPFARYIEWIEQHQPSAGEEFWRQMLTEFREPTLLSAGGATRNSSPAELDISVPEENSRRLLEFAREQRITVNSLIQGAWALTLSRCIGADDVLFGLTVSGRSGQLEGIEHMVGMFINTLPMRVRLPGDMPVATWLRELQIQQLEMYEYEHSAIVDIHGWSEIPRGQIIFDNILVFGDTYQLATQADEVGPYFTMRRRRFVDWTGYPLVVDVRDTGHTQVRFSYESHVIDMAAVKGIVSQFEEMLTLIPDNPDVMLGRITHGHP